jgi:hypothetical protein
MQAVPDTNKVGYNTKRPHQGRGMNGRTPAKAFRGGIPRNSKKGSRHGSALYARWEKAAVYQWVARGCSSSDAQIGGQLIDGRANRRSILFRSRLACVKSTSVS